MDRRLAYEEEGGGRAHQRGDLVGADCHERSHRRLGALPDEPARRRHSLAPLRTAWVDSTLPHPQSVGLLHRPAMCLGSLEDPIVYAQKNEQKFQSHQKWNCMISTSFS